MIVWAAALLAPLRPNPRQVRQRGGLACTHELARLKAWKFGAKTERMNAGQRQMFEETAAEDEAMRAASSMSWQRPMQAR